MLKQKKYYPDNFEQKTGFGKIRNLIKTKCLSTMGEEYADSFHFSSSRNNIVLWLDQTEEFKRICLGENEFPVNHYIDARPVFDKIRIEGTFLTQIELFDLKRSLSTIKNINKFFQKSEENLYPRLRELTSSMVIFPYITDRIDNIINNHGEIKDSASPELQGLRKNIALKGSDISKRMHSILKQAQQEGWVDKDMTLSVRDGKMLIPVPASYKRRIKGIVHDESATGKTSYIEPVEIVEANNKLREMEFAEKREIVKILTNFSNELRPYTEELSASYETLGRLDFIRAKAKLAISLKAVKPSKIQSESKMMWHNAIHPLLYLQFEKEGKKVVPLNAEITQENRIVLISGPNAGGKSVCLKTVGLIQYMFQCGLLIPVSESSEMGIFEQLFIDIGDEQSIENDLSTYSSHLKNMKYFTENANERTLVLIDEFGTGTEPMLGASIAEAILEEINLCNACGVITTHYTSLKHYATSADGIINAAMLFDSHKMQPLFVLEIGKPGSSYAFEIAKKIGLNKNILDKASGKIGQEHVDFDKFLKDIARDRRYAANKRKEVRQLKSKLEKTIEHYTAELDTSEKKRKAILKRSEEEAKQILASANKQIERTIHDIKKSNAEKEKTKEARQKLEDFKKEFEEQRKAEEAQIDAKMEHLKQKRERLRQNKQQRKEIIRKEEKKHILSVNDNVKLENQSTTGQIISIKGNQAEISFGNIRSFVALDKLVYISNKANKKIENNNYFSAVADEISHKKLHFKPDIDLRGKRAEEALQLVEKLIDEAIMCEVNELRILHGTGHGILRKILRDYLNTQQIVKRCRDEQIQFGGAGITIVELDY